MTEATLEHVNITVSDTRKTAEMLCNLFGWKIRWEGDSIHHGYSMHVGGDTSYLAIYSGVKPTASKEVSYDIIGGLNHVAVVVDDLEAVEERVREVGLEAYSHADYEPGRRFYFKDHDGFEYEVVSYV